MKLSSKKQLRADILSQYISGRLYYLDAIHALEVSERHFRRLVKEFREDGIKSLIHGNTGKPAANKLDPVMSDRIIKLYKRIYKGLNVRHFIEKLETIEGINFASYSTIRNLLLKEKLISPQIKRKRKAYPRRFRYEREGLMVQIDGSHHRWILGQKQMCLTAAIDDATGKLVGAKLTQTETTFAAMDVVEEVIKNHGVFQMLYSDKAGIYGGGKRSGYTNMNRAMSELGIISVQANSPQAKGRVERLFRTLQSRLPFEFKLNGIRTMEEANDFLKGYKLKFNEQFAVTAKMPEPAYKNLEENIILDEVFVMEEQRKVGAGHLVCYNSDKYVLDSKNNLIGKQADLREYRDGRLEIHVQGEKIDFYCLDEFKKAA